MIKNKIQMMLSYKNKTQIALKDLLGMSSRQALNNKFSNNRFSTEDLIKICDFLDLEIAIKDKSNGKVIVTLDTDDIKPKE